MLAPYGDNIELKYATNGTVTGIKGGRTIHDYWPKFKNVVVNVSIDGIHDVYDHIRGNGDFAQVEETVKIFKRFPNVKYVVGACTVQAGNALQLPQIIDYFLNTMGIVFYSHRVNYPNVLSAQCLPKKYKDKIITELNYMKEKVTTYPIMDADKRLLPITLQQIQDNINFLQAKDLSSKWEQTLEFNRRLDISRKQKSFESLINAYAS
jgi:sulfatase maturation enzyme AslB (radical SAM superfamily)